MTAAVVAKGRAATTAAGARVVLRRALADAQRDGLVRTNAAALARPPRLERRELEYLDSGQLRRLLAASESHDLGPAIAVAATTGLRQGELLGLRWSDVDLEGGSLTVRRSLALQWDGSMALAEPKTKRSRRTINLPTRAVAALREEGSRQADREAAVGSAWTNPDGLVFTDALGRPLRNDVLTPRYQRVLADAGLPRRSWHALRHSAASAMLAAGVPLKVVSETLGHASITITADTYAHVAPELRREAAEAMDRMLGDEPPRPRLVRREGAA
jgi:integrase